MSHVVGPTTSRTFPFFKYSLLLNLSLTTLTLISLCNQRTLSPPPPPILTCLVSREFLTFSWTSLSALRSLDLFW
uniref:Uncharacterized protein n=1 Tax=Oryza brachyantha TaxID=4533 RepID=J3LM30_ORYBR